MGNFFFYRWSVCASLRINTVTPDAHTKQFGLIWKCVSNDIKTFTATYRHTNRNRKEEKFGTLRLYDYIIRAKSEWKRMSMCVCVKRKNWGRDEKNEFREGNVKCKEIFLRHLKYTKCVPRHVQHFTHCGNNLCIVGFQLRKLQQKPLHTRKHTHQIFWSAKKKRCFDLFLAVSKQQHLPLLWEREREKKKGWRAQKKTIHVYSCSRFPLLPHCVVFRPLSHFIVFMLYQPLFMLCVFFSAVLHIFFGLWFSFVRLVSNHILNQRQYR